MLSHGSKLPSSSTRYTTKHASFCAFTCHIAVLPSMMCMYPLHHETRIIRWRIQRDKCHILLPSTHQICMYLAGEEVVEVAVEGRRRPLVLGDVLDHGGERHFLVHVRVTHSHEIEPEEKSKKVSDLFIHSVIRSFFCCCCCCWW